MRVQIPPSAGGRARLASRLLNALDEQVRLRERGTAARLSKALGKERGWWRDRVRRGTDIGLDNLARVCEFLGLELPLFLSEVAPPDIVAHRPAGDPPSLVLEAWRREHHEPHAGSIGHGAIEELDDLRHRDPKTVIRRTEELLPFVERLVLPKLLGVAGSAARVRMDLDAAEHLIFAGIEIARHQGQLVPSLYQRLGYVAADMGRPLYALQLAEHALLLHARSGSQQGRARALVDQAIWLRRLDRVDDSFCSARAALVELDYDEPDNRCAAWQVIALNELDRGRPAPAELALTEALATARAGGLAASVQIKLHWLLALVLAERGELDHSIEILKEVLAFYLGRHLGEAAIVSCDLVSHQLAVGDLHGLSATLSEMTRLLEPLRGYRRVSEALGNLLRTGRAGLTIALARETKSRLEKLRATRSEWPTNTEPRDADEVRL